MKISGAFLLVILGADNRWNATSGRVDWERTGDRLLEKMSCDTECTEADQRIPDDEYAFYIRHSKFFI